MSSIKQSPAFLAATARLRAKVRDAATEGLTKVMAQAEADAKQMKRWHDPGSYSGLAADGSTWEWQATGAAAASIVGYIVGGPAALRSSNPSQLTTVTRTTAGGSVRKYRHSHAVNAGLMRQRSAEANRITGVLTMTIGYAAYLQKKEIAGGLWGSPSAGLPVTVDVFKVNWAAYYIPQILRPALAKALKKR